jgi:hypothetical protein
MGGKGHDIRAETRLGNLMHSIMSARDRVANMSTTVARFNTELTGVAGPPSESKVGSTGAGAVPHGGVVGELEEATSSLHRSLEDLETLCAHLSRSGVVA